MLAEAHGARTNRIPLEADFGLPAFEKLAQEKWDFNAALTFITTPNAPSGRGYSPDCFNEIASAQSGLVVLDEAYVDFAQENSLHLARAHPNVLVCRTFSKAYSLCSLRIGYAVGHPELIAALDKIRDSYNVNGLGQVAALATLENLDYYQANFRKIIETRRTDYRIAGSFRI